MDIFEKDLQATQQYFDQPRFKGTRRLYSARQVVEQRGRIAQDYTVAREAAQALGAAGLRLEDPRLALQMAAPPRRKDAPEAQQAFVTIKPEPGTLYLWESWLRHEVPPNGGKSQRISISFNYAWS